MAFRFIAPPSSPSSEKNNRFIDIKFFEDSAYHVIHVRKFNVPATPSVCGYRRNFMHVRRH